MSVPTAIDGIVATFSQPFPGPDDSILKFLTLTCTRQSLERVLEVHGDLIIQRSPGLREVLALWATNSRRVLWEPLLGQLREISPATAPEDCYLTLIELGLLAHLDGITGSWFFQLPGRPARIRLGQWLLPNAISGRVQAAQQDGILLVLTGDDGSSYRLHFRHDNSLGRWQIAEMNPGVVKLPSARFLGSELILLPRGIVAEELVPNLAGARFEEISELDAIAERLRRTAALLEEHSPHYLNWVARAVHFIAPTESPRQGSASHPKFPGLVVMSNDHRPWATAEMLVHEASHQYFFMATLLGAADDGSDTQHYYSPLVGRERPIDKVLLSFHALGNMTLLFKDLIAGDIDDGEYCQRRLVSISHQMTQVQAALRKTKALTSLGNALWEPLLARLAD